MSDEAVLASGAVTEPVPLVEWADGPPQTPAQWAYELALIIARARHGPNVDMGGKHNPRPSEQRAAREFVDAILSVGGRGEAAETDEFDRAVDPRVEVGLRKMPRVGRDGRCTGCGRTPARDSGRCGCG